MLAVAAVVAEHERVEPAAVFGGQSVGAGRIVPYPFGEAFGDRLGLLLRGLRLGGVREGFSVRALTFDCYLMLVEQRLIQFPGGFPVGDPFDGGGHPAGAAGDFPRGAAAVGDGHLPVGQ